MSIREVFDGMHQSQTAESREYSVRYIVEGITPVSAFPSYFTWQGVSDPYARLTGLSTGRQLKGNPLTFEITANYSTLPRDNAQAKANKDQPANPLLRPVKRSWSSGYLEIYRPADLDGKAYATTAGELYSGGIATKVPYLIKRYVRNEAYFNENAAISCLWHTNSSKTILCAKFDGSEEFTDNEVSFVEVSYEFWQLKGTTLKWEEKCLDVGSYCLVEAGGPKYPQDADGTKALIPGAVFLDGSGGLGSASSPYWITFRNYDVTSFSSLGLPGV